MYPPYCFSYLNSEFSWRLHFLNYLNYSHVRSLAGGRLRKGGLQKFRSFSRFSKFELCEYESYVFQYFQISQCIMSYSLFLVFNHDTFSSIVYI